MMLILINFRCSIYYNFFFNQINNGSYEFSNDTNLFLSATTRLLYNLILVHIYVLCAVTIPLKFHAEKILPLKVHNLNKFCTK